MNEKLFFLILGSAILGITLAVTNPVMSVSAQEPIVEIGKNYDKEIISTNPDGSQTISLTILSYERISNNGEWVDYIYSDIGTHLQVETANNKILLDKSTCTFNFYNSSNTRLFLDSIIAFQSVVDMYSWNAVTQVNDAACEAYFDGTNHSLVAKRYVAGIGFMEYKYIFNNGKWKTQLEVTNLSSLTNRVFGFDQTIDLNRDIISFGGQQRNLDNFDGQTFNRTFLENNEANILQFLNGVNFDFDIGFAYLDSITIIDTGVNSSKLVFHFMRNNEILMPNETLIIDPSINPSGTNTSIASATQASTSCGSWVSKGSHDYYVLQQSSYSANSACVTPFFTFDTSAIPDSSTIDSVTLSYTGVDAASTRNCDIFAVGVDPTDAGSTAGVLGAIADSHTNYVSNDSTCTTNGAKTELLGAAANSDLEDNLPNDYFAIGIQPVSMTRDGSQHYYQFTLDALEVVYTEIPPPDSITDLTADSVGTTTVSLSFAPPNLNGETLINYMLNVTTPQQGAPITTFWMNGSSSPFSVTGLTLGTPYSAQASAYTAGGGNWTLANVLNFTTTSYALPDAPTLSASLINLTSARFTSTAGASPGDFPVKDYGMRCEINKTTGWLNTVANSTLPVDRIYIYPGLSENDVITCQWRDGSLAGWSPWSGNATLIMIITDSVPGNTPLNDLDEWLIENGGVYFGMGIFTMLFILIGVMASPKTVPIFAFILMAVAGFLHITEIFQMPVWFWGIAVIMLIPIMLKRNN